MVDYLEAAYQSHLSKVRPVRPRESRLEKLQLTGPRNSSRSIAHLQLAEDLVQVPFDRTDGSTEPVGDFLICRPVVEEAKNFTLRFAQWLGQCRRRGFLVMGETFEQMTDEIRRGMPYFLEHHGQSFAFVEEYAPVTRRCRQ